MAPEIITLQLGSFANYVGAHFWNLQDETIASSQLEDWSSVATSIDNGVLCSWSEDRHGIASYCPRTVVVDLSGALGGVSFSPEAAEAAAAGLSCGTWSGAVEVHSLGRAVKSTFRQQLEAASQLDTADEAALAAQQQALEDAALALQEGQEPTYWTDFLQVDLRPASTLALGGTWQGLSQWDGWGPPINTASSRDTAEAAVEQVRWWAEQCDRMQGLQVLSDDLAGWGSLSLNIVQELQEQYPAQPMLYFSLQQQQQREAAAAGNQGSSRGTRRLMSQCLSLAEITQLVSLYVPLTPPADLPSSSMFQAAAVLAAGIDTATLPFRCSGSITDAGTAVGPTDVHSLVHLLTGPGANLAGISLQLPAGYLETNAIAGTAASAAASGVALSLDCSGSRSGSYLLTDGVLLTAEHCLAESLTLRGARSGGYLASSSQAKQALEALLLQRQQASTGLMPCVSHACVSPMPIALPLSFPQWLGVATPWAAAAPLAASAGTGSSSSSTQLPNPRLSRPGLAAAVQAPAVLTRFTATSSFEGLLKSCGRGFQRSCGSAAGRVCLDEWGYSVGDAEELGERLVQLAGQYNVELD